MRKIYPPPFNKFAIFVIYGLLSIAATTLAQNEVQCGMSSDYKYETMGYINLNLQNNPNLEEIEIPWNLYDYINVIAYPVNTQPWNSIDAFGVDLTPLVTHRKNNNGKANIFLSIRNYNPNDWPIPKDGEVDNLYKNIVDETVKALKTVDGVDIEYPGMRGIYCGDWDDGDKENRKANDDRFIKFLGDLKVEMGKSNLPKDKKIMLTVGKDVPVSDDAVATLDGHIDFLNIETYHAAVYENVDFEQPKLDPANPADPGSGKKIISYPNSPLNEFEFAYNEWTGDKKIGKEKIIMGVDFGNTIQVVSNPKIQKNLTVITSTKDIRLIVNPDPDIDANELKRINLCNTELDTKLFLYSFPWKNLLESALDPTKCSGTQNNWEYMYDYYSSTPWLYKQIPNQLAPEFYFVSFESFISLDKKLEFAKDNIGGISISDVSYDDDKYSLLSFIQGKNAKPTSTVAPGPNPPSGKSSSNLPTSTSTDTQNPSDPPEPKPPTGAIVGGVFGSLFILFIIGGGVFWYRNRNQPKSASFKSLLSNFRANPSSMRNHNISGNPEMTDPSPNRFGAVTSTTATVIPVASGYVTAMFDFTGKEENDLSFKKGDKIEILERGDGPNDWWVGRVNGAVGEFPGNYVKET